MDNLYQYYNKILRRELLLKGNYKTTHQIPQIRSIHVHVYFSEAISDKKNILPVLLALEWITGQRASLVKARHSVASFKLRKGAYVGAKVTLRGKKAFAFLNQIISVVLPSIPEFKGYRVKNDGKAHGFDRNGNFTFGIKDLLLFPALQYNYEKFRKLKGVDITIQTTSTSRIENQLLLSGFQFPFTKR